MRILIVEDEISLADLVAERLRKERYIVDVSNDGEDGLFNALSGIYDLILDIMLPGKDGMEILREIKENNIQSKVIMLTAKDQLEDKLKGFAEGANDYVPKPFHIDEVVARVNAQLRIEKAVSNTREYGDIILDYSIPAVINKNTDESIKINNKEFQLLEFFMISHDQVLSKETIFDRIWGMENDLMSNNVEAYISFVRRKLKMLDSKVAINTIRNMGYKMEYMDEGTK